MIFKSKELAELRAENEKLKSELKKIKDQAPQLEQALRFLEDLQAGYGMLEVRRIARDSFFLVSP